jgi:uncharacterized heparinase superfamily protein
MALLFRLVLGASLSPAAEVRLRQMCQIVADFQDATGDVFPIGDDDSGRVLAVDAATTLGRAEVLLRLASVVLDESFAPSAESVRPQSGWWIRRAGDFTVALDFGGVGLCGLGSHAHNDDLSLCLEWRRRPVIVDPGSFLYSSDPDARNRFRSTRLHNTLMIDHREQRELTTSIFSLPGADTAFCAAPMEAGPWAFQRPIGPRTRHRREVKVTPGAMVVRDFVEGSGRHRLRWSFQLHPDVEARLTSRGVVLTVPGAGTLGMTADTGALALAIDESDFSPAYGHRQTGRACVAEGDFDLPVSIEWSVQASE